MAQLWMDGFDHYGGDISRLLEGPWGAISSSVSLTPPAAGARTGDNALKIPESAILREARRVLGGAFAEIFVGMGFYIDTLPSQDGRKYPLQFKTVSNADIATITIRADGALEFRSGGEGGTILGVTTGPAVVTGTWHHIECRILRHASAGIFELRVDEVEVLNLTGLALGATDVGQIAVGQDNSLSSTNFWVDDLIVRDTSGSRNNGFMGDLRIATLQPIANGVAQGWTARTKTKLGVGIMNFQDSSDRDEAVTYADNAVFEIGSGDFCIEAFVRFDNLLTLSETATVFSKWRASVDERSFRLSLNGPDVGANLVFETCTDGLAGDVVEVHAFPFVPETKRWYHIAVARSGTDSRMFLDGVQIGTTKTDSRTYHDNAALVYVNGLQNTATTSLNDSSVDGWFDGVRFTVGVARYTGNFAPPSAVLPPDVGGDPLYDSVELLLNFDSGPTVIDESSNGFTAVLENAPFVEFPADASAYQNVDGLTPDDEDFVEAALVSATETLTFTANPLDTETVTIGATTYTFQTVLVDTANNVFIGVDAETSLDNLKAAVNLEAGAGTLYGTGTVANASASLIDLPDLQVLGTALTPGAAGNSIVSTETVTGGSWGAATFSGGADIPTNSEFTVSALPPAVTGVRSVAIIGRYFKTDSGSSEITASFVEAGGASDAGAARPVTVTPTYYEDTFDEDPSTMGALTPSTLLGARIRLNRTL